MKVWLNWSLQAIALQSFAAQPEIVSARAYGAALAKWKASYPTDHRGLASSHDLYHVKGAAGSCIGNLAQSITVDDP